MATPLPERGVIRFGVFEVDFAAAELRKRGRRVKLEAQPFQVLCALIRRPGELVTRDELRQQLWSADTFVEFDHSLNTAIKKIRQALGDSPRTPHFIETVPRQGYRFIASIDAPEKELAAAASARSWRVVLALVAVVGLLAAGVAIVRWLDRGSQETPLVSVPLTTYPDSEVHPRISPDGTQVAYVACPDDNCDIYIKQIGVEEPYRLTEHPAGDVFPVWSPDGQYIAFIRAPLPPDKTVSIRTIPQRGGPERLIAEQDFSGSNPLPLSGPLLDWTPDGEWMVVAGFETRREHRGVFLLSLETGEKRRLTTPPPGFWGDSAPASSPDGRELVFTRQRDIDRSDIYLLNLSTDFTPEGEPTRLTFELPNNRTPAWTANGKEILFSSGPGPRSGLWRMWPAEAPKQSRLAVSDARASCPTVSRSGERLVYCAGSGDVNIWSLELAGEAEPANPEKLIASTHWDGAPTFSPDGSRIAFGSGRSGTEEIWVCDRDGSNLSQLTAFGLQHALRPRWSSDGKLIAFYSSAEERDEIYTVRANGGAPRRVTNHPAGDQHPSFSQDGKWIYFSSDRGGERSIWKIPASGGDAEQVTTTEADGPQESPDGRFVYFDRGWPHQFSVWRVPVGGGEQVQVATSVHPYACWMVGKQGVYWITIPNESGEMEVRFRGFKTSQEQVLATLNRPLHWGITVSPDGRELLYTQIDEGASDLMLVENFR